MTRQIAIISRSPKLSAANLGLIAAACALQLELHVRHYWDRGDVDVVMSSPNRAVPPDELEPIYVEGVGDEDDLFGADGVSVHLSRQVIERYIGKSSDEHAAAEHSYSLTLASKNGDKHVHVSNFPLPEYFDDEPKKGVTFDYVGKCAHPGSRAEKAKTVEPEAAP